MIGGRLEVVITNGLRPETAQTLASIAVAVDLLLVNPTLTVKGLPQERRLHRRLAWEPRLHTYFATRLGGTEGQLTGTLAALLYRAPACVCVAVGATRPPQPRVVVKQRVQAASFFSHAAPFTPPAVPPATASAPTPSRRRSNAPCRSRRVR